MDIISRKAAQESGLKYYYTGEPCKHGHLANRRVNDYGCMECRKISKNRYYEKYPEKLRYGTLETRQKRKRKYYKENKESISEYNVQYMKSRLEKDPDYKKRNDKRYRDNHPERDAKRRAHKIQSTPKWYESEKIKHLYLKRSQLSKLWGIDLHVDHIVPLQGDNVCGLHCWDNLQLLEATINISKSNKF